MSNSLILELVCSCVCAFGASLSAFKLRAQVSAGAFAIVTAIPIFAAALVLALWRDGQPSVRACALTLTLALALVHTSPPARAHVSTCTREEVEACMAAGSAAGRAARARRAASGGRRGARGGAHADLLGCFWRSNHTSV
jgi:hypothetical protein